MTIRITVLALALLLIAPSAQAANISVKTEDPAPTCSVRVSKSSIRSGQTTVITWNSKHAKSMDGLIKGKTLAPKGKERLAIGFPGKQTYTLRFWGPGGMATCTAKVFVKKQPVER